MQKGERVPGCRKCYEEEDAGKSQSHRLVSNSQTYLTEAIVSSAPQIEFLELATSNLCNLKCRMCFPFYSSAWYEDHHKLTGRAYDGPKHRKLDLAQLKDSWNSLRHIKFTGGEPLMIPEYKKLLEELVARGRAPHIYLNYSTNLTIAPSPEMIALWKQFRYVEFAVSLDGVGEVIEYVRHPSKWNTVDRVLKQILALSYEFDARVGLRSSMMIYNILDLPRIFAYWKEVTAAHFNPQHGSKVWINPTHVQVPEHLSLVTLPPDKKELVRQRLTADTSQTPLERKFTDHLISYMFSHDGSALWPEFIRYTERLDAIRGENFAHLFPELMEPSCAP